MCDGSGGIVLPSGRIATIDDEKSPFVRIFSARGGKSLARVAIPGVSDNDAEPDLEAGARIGGMSLWIGSHGRSREGADRPERRILLGVPVADLEAGSVPSSKVRRLTTLGDALRSWGTGQGLALDAAFGPPGVTVQALAPEEKGVNIEAMTYHPARRQLLIGFRNPIPGGKALVAPLRDPEAALAGGPIAFDTAILLDLGGSGLRDMVWSERHGALLLIAGPFNDAGAFALYRWTSGAPTRVPWPVALPEGFHPETILALPGTDDILVLSDDGDRPVAASAGDCRKDFRDGACTCKNIRSSRAELRGFRGLRMTLAP